MGERAVSDELRHIIFSEAVPRSKKIRFNKSSHIDFILIATYCSILEQSAAMLDTINSGLGYHSYPLLRAQMEGLADITNLCKEPCYAKFIEYQELDSRKKQLLSAKSGNPYLRLVAEQVDLIADLAECGKRMKALERSGVRRLEPKEKLKRAGLKDEYDALFWHLNDHSHGGMRALISRHVREIQGGFEIVAFHHINPGEFDAPIQTSLDSVLRASLEIHNRFNTPEGKFFEGEIARLSI